MRSPPSELLSLWARHHGLRPPPRRDANGGRFRRATLLSLGVHAGLLAALLFWFHRAPAPASGPQTEGAVELLLVEHRGSGPPAAPAAPTPPDTVEAAPVPPVPPPPAVVQAPPLPPVPRSPPMPQEAAKEALPTPAPPTPPPILQSPPIRPQTQQAPRISLGGNDETDAIALGPHVIPASIDAKYHNREPIYPPDAARRSQQGAVILLIHVSPDGLPAGVDVAQTSGFTSLDRAAREAVLTWHFLPAIRDGSPIAFDMALRVVFHLQ